MKPFFIAGHNEKEQGAKAYNDVYEHHYTKELQWLVVQDYNDVCVTDCEHLSLSETIGKINGNSSPGDIVLDFHFNNNNPKARGTEIFIYEHSKPDIRELASLMVSDAAKLLNTPLRRHIGERDYKYPVDIGRRLAMIYDVNIPVILVEVCFLNEFDLPKYISMKRKVSAIYANRLRDYFSKKVK